MAFKPGICGISCKIPRADLRNEILVAWGIAKFAYAQLAHMRTVLRGTLVLADAGIEPAVIVLCRHLYEWNMQTRYAYATFKTHLDGTDLESAWKFFLRISGGNNWVKDHGTKYVPEFPATEVEGSIRIKHSVKAYKEHRTQEFGTENVDDEYSYLSERSHPNGFCLEPYLRVEFPNQVTRSRIWSRIGSSPRLTTWQRCSFISSQKRNCLNLLRAKCKVFSILTFFRPWLVEIYAN